MSKSTHTLNVTKDGTTYTCDLYTTTAEAKVYNPAYLPVNVDGTNLYAALYPTTYSQTFYDNYGTPVHVEKSGTEYVLAQKSLIRLGITAVANETITVTAGGVSWTSGNKYFPYGTTWTATIAGATGWTAGALTPGSSGTLTNANVTVTAGAATYKTFALKLNATTNQTITLKYKNKKSDGTFESEVTKTSTSSQQSFTVGYGTTWTATIAGATGWTAGTLSPGSSGTVTAATTVSAGAATVITPVITFNKTGESYGFTVTYTNTSGTSTTSGSKPSSVTIQYNTTIKIKMTTSGLGPTLQIYQGSTLKKTLSYNQTWTSAALTGNTTFKINGVDTSSTSTGEGD